MTDKQHGRVLMFNLHHNDSGSFNNLAFIKITISVFVLFTWNSSYGLEQQGQELDVTGITSDQTITPLGHNFYQEFARIWSPPKQIRKFNLTIGERPSARWGSLIWISNQNQILYKTSLQPGRDYSRKFAQQAARYLTDKLMRMKIFGHRHEDDLVGNGF